MNLTTLIAECQEAVDDASWDSADLTRYLNLAMTTIAAGVFLPDKTFTHPLADLYAVDTVTSDGTYKAALPEDYQRGLIAASYNDLTVTVSESIHRMTRIFPGYSQSGQPSMVCPVGGYLYIQPAPASGETLTVHYFRKPTAMAAGADEPDGLPEQYHLALVHWVAWTLFDRIEDGMEGRKVNADNNYNLFVRDMAEMNMFNPMPASPVFVTDDRSYNLTDRDYF